MTLIRFTNTAVCDGCGVEITWTPVTLGERFFCCQLCARGLPCECDYPPEEERVAQGGSTLLTAAPETIFT